MADRRVRLTFRLSGPSVALPPTAGGQRDGGGLSQADRTLAKRERIAAFRHRSAPFFPVGDQARIDGHVDGLALAWRQDARAGLLAWLDRRGGTLDDYVFPSRIDHADYLSTRQYARLVDEWVVGVGLRREECGTHSLRRTTASIIYKATGNLRAVQILLGHTKIEGTVRYFGVDVDDALTLAENAVI